MTVTIPKGYRLELWVEGFHRLINLTTQESTPILEDGERFKVGNGKDVPEFDTLQEAVTYICAPKPVTLGQIVGALKEHGSVVCKLTPIQRIVKRKLKLDLLFTMEECSELFKHCHQNIQLKVKGSFRRLVELDLIDPPVWYRELVEFNQELRGKVCELALELEAKK